MISSPPFKTAVLANSQYGFVVPKGLRNLGNSCYMNAVMQSLAVCDNAYHAAKSSAHSSNCHMAVDCVLCSLERCLIDLRRPVAITRNFHPLSRLIRLLPRLSLDGAEMACGRQEDAHEFLSHLLHAANEDGINEQTSDSNKCSLDGNAHTGKGYMHALFDGSICSQVRCRTCCNVSSTSEAIQGLELEVSHAGTLQAALEGYCRTEQLGQDTDNAYDCPVCKAHTTADKSLSVKKAPRLLQIQFKRFVHDPDSQGSQKVRHIVEFPEHLDLLPYLSDAATTDGAAENNATNNSQYQLRAAVVHLGQGLHSGHYTAYVHPSSSTGAAVPWFLVNDDVVRRVPWQEVLAQPAYMLFYELIEPADGTTTPTATSAMSRQFLSPKRVEKRSLSFNVVSNAGGGGAGLSSRLARDLPVSASLHDTQRAQSWHAPTDRAAAYQQHSDQQARSSERDSRFGSNPLFVPSTTSASSSDRNPARLSGAGLSSTLGGGKNQSSAAQYHAEVQRRAARAFSAQPQTDDSLHLSVPAPTTAATTAATAAADSHSSKKARTSYLALPDLGLSRKRLFNSLNLFSGSKRRRDVGELSTHLSNPVSPVTPLRAHTRFSQGGAEAADSGSDGDVVRREQGVAFFEHQQFGESAAVEEKIVQVQVNVPRVREKWELMFDEHSDDEEEEPKRRRLSDTADTTDIAVAVPKVDSVAPQPRSIPRVERVESEKGHVSSAEFKQGEQRKKAGSWLSSIPRKIKALFG